MLARPHFVLGTFAVVAMAVSGGASRRDGCWRRFWAQTLMDRHCTGKSDIPDDQQILGCSDAIKSEALAGTGSRDSFQQPRPGRIAAKANSTLLWHDL